MKVLIVESEPSAGDVVEAVLTASGHDTYRCHDPNCQGSLCSGMGSRCPVEDGVDVAILARNRTGPETSALEDGARCAIRAGVPLVLFGSAVGNPYQRWTTVDLCPDNIEKLAAVAEGAVRDPHPRLSEAATTALIKTLENSGHESSGASGHVYRSSAGSRVVVEVAPTVPMQAARRAAVWVASAVRREPGSGSIIDVVVNTVGTSE